MDSPCDLLEWDTAFFGVRTARVRAHAMDRALAARIDAWCGEHEVQWLYFLARSDDAQTSRVAQEAGFVPVDIRLTFERDLDGYVPIATPLVRAFQEGDLEAAVRIGRSSYTDSRFYYDGRIPREKCDELFEVWTRQSCQGGARQVLVAVQEGLPAAYVTIDVDREKREARIGLIGVDPGHRGKGLGRKLVEGALSWAMGQGLSTMTVVTQGRNIAAQRLYQRCGFVTRSLEVYYHRWSTAPQRGAGP